MQQTHLSRLATKSAVILMLSFFMLTTSGCAAHALMSSDRYEKPKPEETQQFRSSEEISRSWQPEASTLAAAYHARLSS